MSESAPGRIITFYSYKGGTGRSMALANVAWILAANGYRVLTIDWDLEAPGLHRYFHPFLRDRDLGSSEGVIDFVLDFVAEAMNPEEHPAEEDPSWFLPLADIQRYASSLKTELFPEGGKLDFVSAGRQGPEYPERVNLFNWPRFYDDLGGGVFLEAMKANMRQRYDYILIDSRTGVSDTSGICTIQMPDTLVVLFTLNTQGIEGASAVALSAYEQRTKADGVAGMRVLPVPTRVEPAEHVKLEIARELAQSRFDSVLEWQTSSEKQAYWGGIEVQYQPFYAYEEVLATFGDKPGQKNSMLTAMESLAGQITQNPTLTFPPLQDDVRQQVLAQYMRKRKPGNESTRVPGEPKYWCYLTYARADADAYCEQFAADLFREIQALTGIDSATVGFLDAKAISSGEDWELATATAAAQTRVAVMLYSPACFQSVRSGKEFSFFRSSGTPIVPVSWNRTASIPPAAAEVPFLSDELPEVYTKEGLRYVARLSRYRDEYHEVVYRLAERVVVLGRSVTTVARPPRFEDIPNAFAHDAPGAAATSPRTIVVIPMVPLKSEADTSSLGLGLEGYQANRRDWMPFFPVTRRSLGEMLSATAASGGFPVRFVDPDDQIVHLIAQSERDGVLVLLVIDPLAAAVGPYRLLLRQIDERLFLNLGFLTVWTPWEPTATSRLNDLLRTALMRNVGLSTGVSLEVRSAAEFELVLSLLYRLQARVVQSKAAELPRLESRATPPSIMRSSSSS